MDDARGDVAAACRRLAAAGLVIGTAGNVSVRVGERVVVTASGARFEALGPADTSVVDLSGRLIEGDAKPTSELELHLGIYRGSDSGAVVHTHSPAATAVGLVTDTLPCIHYQMLLLGGEIRVAPYATFGTPELAAGVIGALQGRAAALLANHGAVTHAADLPTAVEHALLLEWLCDVYTRAAAIGAPRALDAAAQEAVIRAAIERRYGERAGAGDGSTTDDEGQA